MNKCWLMLLCVGLFACGSNENTESTAGAENALEPLSASNLDSVWSAVNTVQSTLEAEHMHVYSTGVGQCWERDGLCAQVEVQTGASEEGVREAVNAALSRSGYTAHIEVRFHDSNPRQPQAG